MREELKIKPIIEYMRGRAKETWNNTVERILKGREKTWIEAKEMTKNKKLWYKFVHE